MTAALTSTWLQLRIFCRPAPRLSCSQDGSTCWHPPEADRTSTSLAKRYTNLFISKVRQQCCELCNAAKALLLCCAGSSDKGHYLLHAPVRLKQTYLIMIELNTRMHQHMVALICCACRLVWMHQRLWRLLLRVPLPAMLVGSQQQGVLSRAFSFHIRF